MKFTDGYWRLRSGVEPQYPVHVRDVEVKSDRLTVYAPAKRVASRGDTLNMPLLTVQCTAPAPDVIAVRVTRYAGGVDRGPHFRIETDPAASPKVTRDEEYATFTSGELSARFALGDEWRLEFAAGGRVLTTSPRKALAALATDDGHFLREQLELGVGETVYGLGERFGPLVKNGQTVDVWNADGGTSSEQAYKNVPFYVTSGGYGVFVNDPGPVSFEVGSEAVSRVQFSVPGQVLEYLVVYGPTPKEVLRKYTALTGRPALPPAWSFGLWLSTSFTTNYDEATVTAIVDEMAERDLPLSVFHFDTFWMREFHWCDFEWDPETFPDPAGMIARLKAKGLRICLWINPYIAQRSKLFAEGAAAGYLVTYPNGDVWQWDLWQAGMALVDFTNPQARAWYQSKLKALLDLGVDAFKTDFGERIPTDVVWYDGSDPARMHNYYTHLYNEAVFELLREHRGDGEAVLFARSATAGGQQFPVHWGGDCESTFPSMAESVRGGLSLAMSGFGFWSHDIGGFEGTPDPAVFHPVDPVRAAVLAQPAARQRVVPGAVAVRRRGRHRAAGVHPAQGPADAVPVRRGRDRPPRGCAGDAADGAGVPGRPGLRPPGPPVHARRLHPRRPGVQRRRRHRVLPARGPLDGPAQRGGADRAGVGQAPVRYRRSAGARPARLGHRTGRARRPSELRLRGRCDAARLRTARRGGRDGRGPHPAGPAGGNVHGPPVRDRRRGAPRRERGALAGAAGRRRHGGGRGRRPARIPFGSLRRRWRPRRGGRRPGTGDRAPPQLGGTACAG
ncbi:hypothetical protein GCM10020218_035250 [Dactylosporangium vinaceum]